MFNVLFWERPWRQHSNVPPIPLTIYGSLPIEENDSNQYSTYMNLRLYNQASLKETLTIPSFIANK